MRETSIFLVALLVIVLLVLFRSLALNDQPKHSLHSSVPHHNFLADNKDNTMLKDTSKASIQGEAIRSELSPKDYFSLLTQSQFYGKWIRRSNFSRSGFEQEEGLMIWKNSKTNPQNVELTLFDGYYIDKKSIDLSFDFEANSPKISAENASVTFGRLWVSNRYNDYTYFQGALDCN